MFGGIDIIVNNVVVNLVFGLVENMEIWVYDKIMDVNVRGLFELCKWVLLYLKVGGGFIINISSVGGLSLEY